jgi:hypothetical protein
LAQNFSTFAKSFANTEEKNQEIEEDAPLDKVKDDFDATQKQRALEFQGRLRNLLLHFCFASCLFIAVWSPYYSRGGQDWQAVNAVHQFINNPLHHPQLVANSTLNASMSSSAATSAPLFDSISSIDQVWQWMESTLLDMMFASKMYPGGSPDKFLGVAHVINAVRFHQKRVQRSTCDSLDPNLDQIVAGADCYLMWTPENEQKATWGPFNKFRYSIGSGVQSWYQGRLASYDMGGYYTDSVATRTSISEALSDLQVVDWIDVQTRAIFIDFAVYYPSTKGFLSFRFAFEFSPAGGVFSSMDVLPLVLYTFTAMPALVVVEIAVVALQGYFLLQVHIARARLALASHMLPPGHPQHPEAAPRLFPGRGKFDLSGVQLHTHGVHLRKDAVPVYRLSLLPRIIGQEHLCVHARHDPASVRPSQLFGHLSVVLLVYDGLQMPFAAA